LPQEHKNQEAVPQLFEVEVLNIPDDLSEEDAKRFFLQFGKVYSVNVQHFTRRCIVSFTSEEARVKAI